MPLLSGLRIGVNNMRRPADSHAFRSAAQLAASRATGTGRANCLLFLIRLLSRGAAEAGRISLGIKASRLASPFPLHSLGSRLTIWQGACGLKSFFANPIL